MVVFYGDKEKKKEIIRHLIYRPFQIWSPIFCKFLEKKIGDNKEYILTHFSPYSDGSTFQTVPREERKDILVIALCGLSGSPVFLFLVL